MAAEILNLGVVCLLFWYSNIQNEDSILNVSNRGLYAVNVLLFEVENDIFGQLYCNLSLAKL